MKQKTISGHYDTVYNIEHNNRIFVPNNVDVTRIVWNYNCVASGQVASIDPDQPRDLQEFWKKYREISDIYWSERSIHQTMAYRKYLDQQKEIRRYYQALHEIPNNPVSALITLLFLPILIPCGIYLHRQHKLAKEAYDEMMHDQWIRDLSYKATRASLRSALYTRDLRTGTQYLRTMDTLVSEMSQYGKDYIQTHADEESVTPKEYRYATLEEIYDKIFEPAFQEFQAKQRPCRRYKGTYLEQIRENQAREKKKKQQSKNSKNRSTAEAIEIVFTIGDMDNTGYAAAYMDAKQAEELLKDFCDHLLEQPNVCVVTTLELENPDWQPPFKHGIIIVNMVVHADEATPGIHLTCIPYSRDCKRGPGVQASLGRAMTGMGYPSTWVDKLDENGEKIPKKNKDREIVYNKDGSVHYKQEPDKQGIIDWIENQKRWIQAEMLRRYDWTREYKGSHPRGNLSTPDYQVARAQERQEELTRLIQESMHQYDRRIYDLSVNLDNKVGTFLENSENQQLILKYLELCSDEEYDAEVDRAYQYLDQLAAKEQDAVRQALIAQIQEAEHKRNTNSPKNVTKTHNR